MEALLLPARETWEQIVKWMRIGLRGDAREQDRRGTDRPKGLGAGVARGCGDDCEREQNSQPDALIFDILDKNEDIGSEEAVFCEKG